MNPFDQFFSNGNQETAQPQQNVFDQFIPKQDSTSLKNAQGNLGSEDYNGLCEKFVEQMTGSPNMGRSAAEAWNNYVQRKQAFQGLSSAKPGDPIYFSPDQSNEENGHTGLYMGDNKFIAATDNGVKTYDVNDWQKLTGQKLLGFVKNGR